MTEVDLKLSYDRFSAAYVSDELSEEVLMLSKTGHACEPIYTYQRATKSHGTFKQTPL